MRIIQRNKDVCSEPNERSKRKGNVIGELRDEEYDNERTMNQTITGILPRSFARSCDNALSGSTLTAPALVVNGNLLSGNGRRDCYSAVGVH